MSEGSSNQPSTDMYHVSIEEQDLNRTEFKDDEELYNATLNTSGGVVHDDEPLEGESVSEEELLLPKEEVMDPLEEESGETVPETVPAEVHTEKTEDENQQNEIVKLQQELHECARRHGRKRADILTSPRKKNFIVTIFPIVKLLKFSV